MTVTNTTLAALCRAIDAGDDSCLPILADCLDDCGDGRAWAIRWMGASRYAPRAGLCEPPRWGWMELPEEERACGAEGTLYPTTFGRLRGEVATGDMGEPICHYPTRSAAFLALATALCEP